MVSLGNITDFAISMGGSKKVGEKPVSHLTFLFTLSWPLTSSGSLSSGTVFYFLFGLGNGSTPLDYDLWNSTGDVTWVLKNITTSAIETFPPLEGGGGK